MNEILDSESLKDDAPVCRLRYGLNENCLLHVFEYLDESDLINLCVMDRYYKDLILKWTIKQKRVTLRQPRHNGLKGFKIFAKSMRKVDIYSHQFISTIETIMKYCEPDQLSEMNMSVQDAYGLSKWSDEVDSLLRITQQAMPFFSNLRKLKFEAYCDEDSDLFTKFLTQISNTALNLSSLEIDQLELCGGWLQNMRNLRELRINWKSGTFDSLLSYLEGRPNLKSFKLMHQLSDVTPVYDTLAEYCPNLETFVDEDRTLTKHYRQFEDSMTSRYAFLSKFSNLSHVTLTTYTVCGSDLYYPLVSLATKDIVKLTIFTSLSKPIVLHKGVKNDIMRRPLPQFDRLRAVKFDISTTNSFVIKKKWDRCDLRGEFLFHFLRYARNLQNFALCGSCLKNVENVVENLPTIRVLDLSQMYSVELYNIVTKVVSYVVDFSLHAGIFQLILKDDGTVEFFKNHSGLKDRINFTFTTENRWRR